MLKFAKILNETKICDVYGGKNEEWAIAHGFEEMDVELAYNGAYYLAGYAPVKPREFEINEEIATLKVQLDTTDYKIIKSTEYQMVGLEAPYDIAQLHSERQELRNKINELEQELEENNQNNSSIGD